MTLSLSPRLRAYTALAAIALIAALAFGRPDLAVLATPFVVLLGIAFVGVPLALDGRLELDRERALEGESVRAIITVRNLGAPARIQVRPPETERLRTNASPIECWLSAGEQRAVGFELKVGRWGVLAAGPAIVRAHDRLGTFTLERPLAGAPELRAYPRVDRLHRLVAPLRSRPVLGSQVSRERGEGIEFADLRPLIPGDRVAVSTGARAPGAASPTSTCNIRSTARTSSCSSTRSPTPSAQRRGRSTRRSTRLPRSPRRI